MQDWTNRLVVLFGRKKEQDQERLERGLEKTRTNFFGRVVRLVRGKDTVDDAVLDELEEVLITSDVGVKTTIDIIRRVQDRVKRDRYVTPEELTSLIQDEIARLLHGQRHQDFDAPLKSHPHVILVVGVNGVGKTTTIGKMAHHYAQAGRSVVVGAADTFRAAAIEQLEVWTQRAGATLIKQKQGSDPASVAFDTVQSAIVRDADVVLIDTAGRLHTRTGLMDELAKVKRIIGRRLPGAPHEVLLVLDAAIGQNAMRQAEQFTSSVDVTGLVVTKLDGTAKGGIIIGISNELQVPVQYIGVGEQLNDLQVFDAKRFVAALSV